MAFETRRQYVTKAQIQEFSNISITDEDEASDRANWAEEMIDAYVGFQTKHIKDEHKGKATGGTTTTIVDDSNDSPLDDFDDDYYTFCEVEIIGGTNAGEKRVVTGYDKSANQLTVRNAFTSAIDSTSVYVIRQIGKFPRQSDTHLEEDDDTYYKFIPEAVTRATLAQIEYIIEKGNDFFTGAADYDSERIGNYSYTISGSTAKRLISPHARRLLRGIVNRKGRIIA